MGNREKFAGTKEGNTSKKQLLAENINTFRVHRKHTKHLKRKLIYRVVNWVRKFR